MKIIRTPQGAEVATFVTPSGVTAYVDTSMPIEALEGLRAKLLASLNARPSTPSSNPPLQTPE